MSDNAFHTITAEGTIGCDGSRELGNLITIGANITGDVVFQSPASVLPVTEVELHTFVFHLTGIDPLHTSLAHSSYASHLHQDIGGLFVIPVEAAVERIAKRV